MDIIRNIRQILQRMISSKMTGQDADALVVQLTQNLTAYALQKEVSDSTYRIKKEDLGYIIYFKNACTISADDKLPNNFQCVTVKEGTGDLTYSGFSGKGNTLATQYTTATIIKKRTSLFIFGELTTV